MPQISTLHDLARSGLRDLAGYRVMPSGYNRALSRRTDVMAMELIPMLAALLPNIPDTLMARPGHARWQELVAIATQERLLKDMVSRWVTLLETEPKPDQQTACALATAREQVAGASRLMSRLEAIAKELDEAQVVISHCRFDAELDLGETREAVTRVLSQTAELQKRLDGYAETLEDDITT